MTISALPTAGVDPPATGFDELTVRRLRGRPGAKWRVPARDVLPAWVADMDFPVAPPVQAALHRLVQTGDLGYPHWPDGTTPLRELFAERMADRYGWHPDPARVREFTDVTQAVQAVLHLATEPGDGVALHTPGFGPFCRTIPAMNRRLLPIPMVDHPRVGWAFDADRLAEQLRTTPCRVLLLVNPQNPTGRVFRRDELQRLAELAERHDLLVISDEIHAELAYRPHRHIPFASLGPDAAARTVTLTSASKAFNLAGARCAVGHLGPQWLREAFVGQPSGLFGNIGLFGVAATLAAWTAGADWLAGTVDYLDGNRRLVAEVLADELPEIRHHRPEATYLAWLDCRALGWAAAPAEVFRDRGRVELTPGTEFNPGGDGFVRLNFATSRPVLEQILDRLVRAATPVRAAA